MGFDDIALTGVLHVFVAFDWGEEIRLEMARQLRPAQSGDLIRRSRTPSSISYRPTPLRFELPSATIELPHVGAVSGTVTATAFDFGAISIGMRLPFSLTASSLSGLAAGLSEPATLIQHALCASEDLYQSLLPAIRQPQRMDISEEYFVFQLIPDVKHSAPEQLLESDAAWLAGLLRLEKEPLSEAEVAEAIRLRLTYSPSDLLVCEWSAAVLVDTDCDETLQIIEFANVQLLEFRHIDRRLDNRIDEAYRLIYPLARSWLPFWRTHTRPLRALGEMKVEANGLFERASSTLKLVGDQYLARVYRLLASRFHLDEWQKNIHQSLDVVQEVYQVISDQAATYRTELLEIIVVVLILFEIIMAIVRH